ncbi:unnamed protein product [Brassicogethes aeneus]|uniref:Large ribosomal subunit protein mL40 n=1 Tax=Brassicogethes aeneus TaxID=1431903 RepID=A0A9P0FCF8_BRAAE|nr:unnamed protein product [Brassicogethes aeneus]
MSVYSLINNVARLSLQTSFSNTISRNVSTSTSLLFRATPCLMAEPLKKKKRLDPAIVRSREERKKKKIEKQIRRLEKNARQLKPIQECEVSLAILDDRSKRERNLPALSGEIVEKRILLEKKWALFKREQHLKDIQLIDRIGYSQQRAMDELRNESEELYQEALQIDFQLLPFSSQGPVETPPIKDYQPPDGDYQDISKVWQ